MALEAEHHTRCASTEDHREAAAAFVEKRAPKFRGARIDSGRAQAVTVSVVHVDDEARALVLGVLLEAVLSWVRGLPGSQRLRGLVVFDEGFCRPTRVTHR